MRIVDRLGGRYRMRGCGQELIYACGRRTKSTGIGRTRSKSKVGAVIGLFGMLFIGPTVTSTRCRLVVSRTIYRAPNAAPSGQPVATVKRQRGEKDSDIAWARKEMVRIRPQLLECVKKWPQSQSITVPVRLHVKANGRVSRAFIEDDEIDAKTRLCLREAFRAVRFLARRTASARFLVYRVQIR
jgi:hypothetical protein